MPASPSHHSDTSSLTQTLAVLASIVGNEFDLHRAQVAVQNASQGGGDPLKELVAAAAETSMNISPLRLPFKELIWQAHHDTPVVIWNEKTSRWIVITSAGWFHLRIADGNQYDQRHRMTRGALADVLELKNLNEVVEAGVVYPSRPAQSLSNSSAHHGHHEGGISPAKRFLRLLRAEKQDIRTLLIFSVFSGLLYLAAPLAVDAVVSNLAFGSQQQPYVQALFVLGIALFACLALQAIVTGFQYYLSDIIQRRIFVRVASDLAHRLPRVKAETLDSVHAPELVNRFLDVVTAQKNASLLILDGVNLTFSTLIGMLFLALYHPALMLFVAIMLTLIVIVIWLFGRGAVKTSIEESMMKYDLVNWYEEIAHFPFLFKGPGGYEMASARANQLTAGYVNARARHFRILMRQIAGLLTLQVFAAATLLILGGYLVISQQITLGQLVASELIMSGIVAALSKFGKKLEAWYDALAAMDKLGHIFDIQTERDDGERPTQREPGAEVTASALTFGHHHQAPLFENLSFNLKASSRIAIVGPHGAGVSSMLDILFGLRQPSSGSVTIDGLDLRSWNLEALREDVQMLRRAEIIEATVVQNLRLGRSDIGLDDIRAALTKVGLLEDLLRRPEGLNLRLKIGGAPLSSNQRTRLILARALVQCPRLLLIDELLDGLDSDSFQELSSAILDPSLPWTVVVGTRDYDVTKKCDQIIELSPCHLSNGSPSKSK